MVTSVSLFLFVSLPHMELLYSYNTLDKRKLEIVVVIAMFLSKSNKPHMLVFYEICQALKRITDASRGSQMAAWNWFQEEGSLESSNVFWGPQSSQNMRLKTRRRQTTKPRETAAFIAFQCFCGNHRCSVTPPALKFYFSLGGSQINLCLSYLFLEHRKTKVPKHGWS